MTADEALKMAKAAKSSKELEKVISKITEAAKKGKSHITISEEQFNLTRAALTQLGYVVIMVNETKYSVIWWI